MTRIIDSHCHVYPEAIAAKAVKGVSDFYDGVNSYGDGLASTVRDSYKGKGADHAVIFSVATRLKQVDSINNFIAKAVSESEGFFTGLGTVHQDTPDMGAVVDQIVSLGLRGVKLHPDTQEVCIDDPRLFPLYEACAGLIPVLLHTGDYRYDYSNPNRMEPVLKMFPKTTFIGAHYGGWSVWDESTEKLHKYDNFFVDSSSTSNWVEDEKIKGYIASYGSEKVIFGSDFPMWDVEVEIQRMLRLGLKESEYENIFHRNAERIFGI